MKDEFSGLREMRVFKCLSRLKLRADVKNLLFVESVAFKDSSVWEICFLLWYYNSKYNNRMVPVCF